LNLVFAREEFFVADISQPRARATALPLLRLDQLWVVFALSMIALFISLVPTLPNDFWWHLKAGELIATSGLPRTNLFAWALPADQPYVYQSWLGEYLFYVLYQLGGFPLVVFARNLLGTAAFALVAVETQRRTGSWRWAAGAALFAAAMTINNLTTRTQNWSWVPFMLTFMVLSRYSEGRLRPQWLLLLPLIMAFWVNAHGAFVMGILVAGAFAVGETLRRLLRQPRSLNWFQLRWLYLACFAMVLATVINPLGVGIYGYLRTMLSDPSSQQLIIEWQSPTPRSLAGGLFYASVLAVIVAFAYARRRPTITELIVLCGLAWQAFVGVRYVVWFGMVAMPIAAQALATPRPVFALEPQARPAPSARERGGGALANLVVAVLLVLLVASAQPWFKPLLPMPAAYTEQFVDLPGARQLFTLSTPVAAVEHLRSQPCAGPIFNEMGQGSYMAWALYPQAQAFIDPRVELYPLALWQDYIEITRGYRLETQFERYNIACVLLDTELQPRLAKAMNELPGWQQSFNDGRSEVWRR
jgi:hypothetical protein